ncbi:hypothetical protein L1887_34277 [Cichorium endivia]|nr:hypothetical protein L1887_34277 [Cichorium endivia]
MLVVFEWSGIVGLVEVAFDFYCRVSNAFPLVSMKRISVCVKWYAVVENECKVMRKVIERGKRIGKGGQSHSNMALMASQNMQRGSRRASRVMQSSLIRRSRGSPTLIKVVGSKIQSLGEAQATDSKLSTAVNQEWLKQGV